jgi:DNA-binding transcriptional regulator GbsR (MarR family)
MSKGSVSQGLKFLTRMGALRTVYSPTDRRTLYEPELSLRRLLIGILNENVLPHLSQGTDRVADLRAQLNGAPKEQRAVLEKRLETIEGWGKKTKMVWPVVEKAIGGAIRK